jgi:uncharacterized protein
VSFNEGVSIDTSHASRGGGGRGGVAIGGGLGGIVVLVLALVLGVDPSDLTGGGTGAPPAGGGQDLAAQCRTAEDANTDPECRVVATENSLDAYWSRALPEQLGVAYQRPATVVFSGGTSTACGNATSAVGPFYCPADQGMYFDVSFFEDLRGRFGAQGGPLAEMYVVAHEFGHHVQNALGVLQNAQRDPRGPESGAVRTELMADCLAGVWAHHASTTVDVDTGTTYLAELTESDVRAALSAAAAVGDDRIQESVQGQVNPEAWTHGSSEQRMGWFTTGYRTGDPNRCDTFAADDLG